MDLEREKLERIDRKLLARLGQDEAFQMVRVPVTAAKWATWKRYCEAGGTSMGRAIVALIERELGVFDDVDDDQPSSTGDAQEQLAAREEELNVRERELATERNRVKAEANVCASGTPSCGASNTTWRPDRGLPLNPRKPTRKSVVMSGALAAQDASTSNAMADEAGTSQRREEESPHGRQLVSTFLGGDELCRIRHC